MAYELRTGQRAERGGKFELARHLDGSAHQTTPDQAFIPLARGDIAPPCGKCRSGVVWRLVEQF